VQYSIYLQLASLECTSLLLSDNILWVAWADFQPNVKLILSFRARC